MTANRNTLWAEALADELARHGLRHAALSPGSRSAPLAIAFHAHPRIQTTVHIDERSAAYVALGTARATGMPAAVVSTSGTAAANDLPAVVEADAAGVPLIVITADRPFELVGVGANQAIDQLKLYGDRVRLFANLGPPEATHAAMGHLRTMAARAWGRALGPPAGPVHLNVPLREPLDPAPVVGDVPTDLEQTLLHGRPDGRPYASVAAASWTPDADAVAQVADVATASGRGLIIVGPRSRADALAAVIPQLAAKLQCPVLADPLSGLRSQDAAADAVLTHYDAWLGSRSAAALAPDWVLQFGATPTSKRLTTWLADNPQTDRTVIDESGRLPDAAHTARRLVAADPDAFAEALTARLVQPAQPDDEWQRQLAAAETAAEAAIGRAGAWEGTIPGDTAKGLGPHDALFVSSSLPVRDLDRYGGFLPPGVRVLANRGASGIDGVVSTAAGAAVALDARLRAVVGDVALHHDLNGVAALARLAPRATLVVVNNGGGAIFDQLPVARTDVAFDELFRTPPGLDLERVADLFGMPFSRVLDGADVAGAIGRAEGGLIEVVVEAKDSLGRRTALDTQVVHAVDEALTGTARSGTPA